MSSYTPETIEPKWQAYWDTTQAFIAPDSQSKPKYYCLIEFPYPSGDGLHVGHPRPYTAMDIIARKRRMEGYAVLYPIGFDSFGLPTEGYAIKTGQPPQLITEKNIATFTTQMKMLGLSFDWSRQVITSDPAYYRWTQWIFLQLFKHGLAYKTTASVNWCPSCKIGLANEEVVNGRCERCGTVVEKRLKDQWMLEITRYAERLITDLRDVDYVEQIKSQQLNWIGRSEGVEIIFPLADSQETLTVFTTRPDTLFGVTCMVVAPEHGIISNLKSQISNLADVEPYVQQALKKSDLERTEQSRQKTGIKLEGINARNPLNGQPIEIWVAEYVLASYGTGAIMAVPAHDQRDWEFAHRNGLPITQVIQLTNDQPIDLTQHAYEPEEGVLMNSGQFDGSSTTVGGQAIIDELIIHQVGRRTVNYKMRDWVFSRQRYWGEPIPLVYCQSCAEKIKPAFAKASAGRSQKSKIKDTEYSQGELRNPGWVALPDDQLPLVLPEIEKYQPTDSGESPLATVTDWVTTTCPKCGGPAKRETDTMPNWAGSNWYYLRYTDPTNQTALARARRLSYWMPVDWYNGGMEHTTLHLLYSRFIYKFLYDIGAVPQQCGSEPYRKRTSHGLVLGEGGVKMSKSKGNVVNPNDVVKHYGADTLRVYEMFMGPFDQAIPWDTNGVKGVRRFLEKTWLLYQRYHESGPQTDDGVTMSLLHRTIKKVGADIETMDFNTAVSALMILVNQLVDNKGMSQSTAETVLKLLSPFAPHITEELWQQLGHQASISLEAWPEYDEQLTHQNEITLVVQINGKMRDRLTVPADIIQQQAEELARRRPKVAAGLAGKIIQNIIFVPGRLINFVIA